MFNVLIVDDEPMIREGLKTIIDWESFGFTVVDTAANGRDGLDKIKELKPDLTIIDIRMPGMTGLDVIEEARAAMISTHFLILSGYADFDYAKRAIGYGVNGYLLKPLDEEELGEELQRIGAILTREKQSHRSAEEDHVFREHLLESFLLQEESLRDPAMVMQLGLDWPRYQIVLLEIHGSADDAPLAALRRKLSGHFEGAERVIVFSAGPFAAVLWDRGMSREDDAVRCYAEWGALLPDNKGWFAAAGGAVTDISLIGQSYAEAAGLLHHRFLFHDERLMLPGDLPLMAEAYPEKAPLDPTGEIELSDMLYYALDIRSMEAVGRFFDELEERVVGFGQAEQTVKSAVTHILTMAINKLSGQNQALYPLLQDAPLFITEAFRQPTWEQLKAVAAAHLSSLIERIGGGSKDAVLKQMIDFIHRNYKENLKLELLAQVFNYNSAYLGKMFKNYTGENFNAFLDNVRIEHAKELLSQGLKVHQVAACVGYANVDYFHSKFKKYVGASPSSFRKKEPSE